MTIKPLTKILIVSGLITSLVGCGNESITQKRKQLEFAKSTHSLSEEGLARLDSLIAADSLKQFAKVDSAYAFYRFGPKPIEYGEYVGIVTGDFDGDGDLDIAVLNNRSGESFTVYENKMPQKRVQPYSSERDTLKPK